MTASTAVLGPEGAPKVAVTVAVPSLLHVSLGAEAVGAFIRELTVGAVVIVPQPKCAAAPTAAASQVLLLSGFGICCATPQTACTVCDPAVKVPSTAKSCPPYAKNSWKASIRFISWAL